MVARDLEMQGKTVYGFNLGGYIGDGVRWIYAISKEKADHVLPLVLPKVPVNINRVRDTIEAIAPPVFGAAALVAAAVLALSWWRASRSGERK
ncbi:MAG: hypothetical protein QXS85_01945 [Acidilobaceae archaeon]